MDSMVSDQGATNPEDGKDVGYEDWFNDMQELEDDVQNQAAAITEDTKETRVPRVKGEAKEGEQQITDDATRLGGQLILKFKNTNGELAVKRASAHIAHKDVDGYWTALTSRSNLMTSKGFELMDSVFILQKGSNNQCLGYFKFTPDDIRNIDEGFSLHDENKDSDGKNLSAIRIRAEMSQPLKKGKAAPKADEIIGNVPALEAVDDAEIEGLDEENQTLLSGYPHKLVEDGDYNVDNKEFKMYSDDEFAALTFKNDTILGSDKQTSAGQSGGAMTKKSGQVVGIFTGVARHEEYEDGELALCVRMTEDVVKWVK